MFPLMLFLMVTILMVQLHELPAAVPGAADGAAGAHRRGRGAAARRGAPMGFVAILGVISLIGMVIRNSVILIDQIDEHIADGRAPVGRR